MMKLSYVFFFVLSFFPSFPGAYSSFRVPCRGDFIRELLLTGFMHLVVNCHNNIHNII